MHRALALWVVVFAAFATTVGLRAAPGEDLGAGEAHVVLAAQSIVSDRDLDLRDEYGGREWRAFFDGDLVPLTGPRGGRLLEPTGIGLPLLIAPALAVGGVVAVQLLLAAIAALGFVLAATLARRLVPDPWATIAVLVVAVSPPALVASTTIAPDAVAATALAGAALLALSARERPRVATTFAAGVLLALLPWLAVRFLAPGAVAALALWRWSRRRRRTVAGLLGIEAILFSLVLYASLNDRLYGGLTPDAVLPAGVSATGIDEATDLLGRLPRLLMLWVDPQLGLLRWAPFLLLAFAGAWRLARSRRERLAVALTDQVDVDVAGTLLAAMVGAAVLVAVLLAPTLGGDAFAGHALVGVLPLVGALAALGLRRWPRLGYGLAAVTVALSLWLLIAVRVDDEAGVAPPRGPLPIGVR